MIPSGTDYTGATVIRRKKSGLLVQVDALPWEARYAYGVEGELVTGSFFVRHNIYAI